MSDLTAILGGPFEVPAAAAQTFAARGIPLADQGIPVFPCDATRKPHTAHGFKNATTEKAQIVRWSVKWPDALVAVPTGAASGLVVLDVDVKNGKDGFASLAANGWELPLTRTHKTQNGGGRHFLFRFNQAHALKCSANQLGDGLDVRTNGGYVIWWPAHGFEVEHADIIADVPDWLLEAERARKARPAAALPATTKPGADRYASRAYEAAVSSVASSPEGGRNDALNRAAHGLSGLAKAGRLDPGQVTEALRRAAHGAGLAEAEIEATLKSAWDAAAPRYDGLQNTPDRVRSDGAPDAIPAGGGWPEPMPLPKLPSVPAFPVDLLPEGLRRWIGDAADRAKFPPDFAAVAAMCALGSVIGRKLGIRLKRRDDWTEHANLWGGLIGPPSALKSPALREALRPFKALQLAADAAHAKEQQEHAAQLESFRLRKDATRKAISKRLSKDPDAEIDLGDLMMPPEEPAPRTYWTSNANEASLGVLLEQNPNGLLIERDELSALLVNLEDERNADLRGILLSGWSGKEGYRFDRIGRGVTLLPKFAVSIVGGIQPGPLARYVRSAFSGERADGLLQRFQLLVWPDVVEFEYVDRYPDASAKRAAADLFERADTFDPYAIGSRDDFGDDPPFIRLGDAAQGLFIEWYENFMRERRAAETGGEVAPLAAHFGKFPGLVGKLALILHVADDPGACEVSERTMLKALAWVEYLMPHARRVYHAVTHPETGAAELLLARLKRGELPSSFKAWEVSRKQWHGLADREAVKKACRILHEFGWLIELDSGGATGGRPADPVYAVSPAAEVTR